MITFKQAQDIHDRLLWDDILEPYQYVDVPRHLDNIENAISQDKSVNIPRMEMFESAKDSYRMYQSLPTLVRGHMRNGIQCGCGLI